MASGRVCKHYKAATHKNRYLTSAGLGALMLLSTAAWAQDSSPLIEFDIEAQSLESALRTYSVVADKQVMFSTDIVRDKRAGPVTGEMTDAEALGRLLKGSDLVFEATDTDVILIRTPQKQAMLVQEPVRIAQVQEVKETHRDDNRDEPEANKKDEITVTGTLIKGIAPKSSPVQTFNREDILNSGTSSTEDFLRRSVVQNFGGGSSEFARRGLPNDNSAGSNSTFATGANLRGLGSGATLTLLNGNRLAPTSEIGDFVDLSVIPISALERIDVLTDGASSIYGGDAVAGVVNFILRDDFEGAETSLRYGTVTNGDMDEVRASQTLGTAWYSGNVLGTYEYFNRESLALSDRPEIAPSMLIGGEPVSNLDSFYLLPAQEKHTGLISGAQQLSEAISINATGLYANRNARSVDVLASTVATITTTDIKSENFSLAFGADYTIDSNWTASLDFNFSKLRNTEQGQNIAPTMFDPYGYRTRSRLWSAEGLINGVLIRLPGGPVSIAIGGQYREESFAHSLIGGDASADGSRTVFAAYGEVNIPLIGESNQLPIFHRLNLNVSNRMDDYSDFGTTVNPKVGLSWYVTENFNVRGSYSTSFNPPPLGRVGALDRTGVVLPYDLVRSLFSIPLPDPALAGIDYLQVSGTDSDLRAESSRTFTVGADHAIEQGRHSWQTHATYYDIHFDGRLNTTPVPGNLRNEFAAGLAFENPALFPPGTIVFFPSEQAVGDVVSTLNILRFVGGPTNLDNIGFINNVLVARNLASTETRGIDLDTAYRFEADFGEFSAGLNVNYIIDFTRQAAESTPSISTLNTLYNPVDLRVRGRAGVSAGGLSGNVFVNYVPGYRTDDSSASAPIDSWTTVDLSLLYKLDRAQSHWLNGTVFGIGVQNLFDQSPPMTLPSGLFSLAGYDPANASPVGRFVTIELRKTF